VGRAERLSGCELRKHSNIHFFDEKQVPGLEELVRKGCLFELHLSFIGDLGFGKQKISDKRVSKHSTLRT
jgi:hypothetical protein